METTEQKIKKDSFFYRYRYILVSYVSMLFFFMVCTNIFFHEIIRSDNDNRSPFLFVHNDGGETDNNTSYLDNKYLKFRGADEEASLASNTQLQQLDTLGNLSSSSTTTTTVLRVTNNTQWHPSNDWIHNCVTDKFSESDDDTKEFIMPFKIALADCIKFCRCYHRSLPDTALNKMYYKRACPFKNVDPDPKVPGNFNLSIIDEIHNIQSSYPNFTVPETNQVVIHLRLGDIVETSPSTVEKMLIDGADPGYPTKNFRNSIKSVYELLDNIHTSGARTVSIVGGSHRKEYWKKSRVYAQCVYRAIETAGYNVTMQIEGNHPDVDFYYASHAKLLIVSGGGYSNLMAMLAERRGGKVIGRKFGVAW